jgi:ADP-heptose:LPS heptosyltransferase
MMTDPDKVKKILDITLNNLGDVISTTPAISFLREKFPSSFLAVLVGPKARMVIEGSRSIDKVLIYDKNASWWEKLKLVLALRKEKFDLVVDLKNTAIPFLIGAKYRTPLGLDRSMSLMRDQHLSRLKGLLCLDFDRENSFEFFSPAEKESAFRYVKSALGKQEISEHIIIACGARLPLKRWTAKGFSEVANHFLKQRKDIILVGSADEAPVAEELKRNISFPVANLAGKLSFRESAALFASASLIVANDSALLHLALELNRPVVGVFGPTDETKCGRRGAKYQWVRVTGLPCARCLRSQCLLDRRVCLEDLPGSMVVDACEALLK